MTNPEEKFQRELEIFRTEAQSGIQFFYTYLAFNAIIGDNKKVLDTVNKTSLFWKTNIGALQTAFFIALGRIFDQKSKHNIDTLLRTAQKNVSIFSKESLGNRKSQSSPNAYQWLDDYLKRAYVPSAEDFRRLRKHVKKYRNIYVSNYRDIRRKIFAHKELSDKADIQQLWNKTKIRELERLFVFLNQIYEAFWELFHNGCKPVLRPMKYSVQSIRKRRLSNRQSSSLQERMIDETETFLKLLVRDAQHGSSVDS